MYFPNISGGDKNSNILSNVPNNPYLFYDIAYTLLSYMESLETNNEKLF